MFSKICFCFTMFFVALSLACQSALALDFAHLKVTQNTASNNIAAISIATPQHTPNFFVSGGNRGDYDIRIGATGADDFVGGALITSVAELGRDNDAVGDTGGLFRATSASDLGGNGYFIPIHKSPAGSEGNINVAAGYFPYDDFIGGTADNSTNNGPITSVIGSTSVNLGTTFIDNGGNYTLNVPAANSNTGVLLVTHAKNEDNYALSRANGDGSFTIFPKDNGSNGSGTEAEPVAFTYIPQNHPDIIVGRFAGDGTKKIEATPGAYNLTPAGTGTLRLSIPGHNPESGVLLVSPEGGNFLNTDNIVSYQPDGNDWLIETRDLAGVGLQNVGSEDMASFAFLPLPQNQNPNNITTSFQQGVNGYTGTLDMRVGQADGGGATFAELGSNFPEYFMDGSGPETAYGLIRFDDLIGPSAGQIPDGAVIVNAELQLVTGTSSGNAGSGGPFNIHELLVPFDSSSDFNNPFGANGPDATEFGSILSSASQYARSMPSWFDVTDAVRNWASGGDNFGLIITPGTGDGWQIFTSGAGDEALRPRLEVTYFLRDPNAIPEPTTAVLAMLGVAALARRRNR